MWQLIFHIQNLGIYFCIFCFLSVFLILFSSIMSFLIVRSPADSDEMTGDDLASMCIENQSPPEKYLLYSSTFLMTQLDIS